MRENGRRIKWINWKKIAATFFITMFLLLTAYFILVNLLVSAALVPSFMEKLEAFERITEESYEAQVQTSDIKINRAAALKKTKEWLESADHQKLSVKTEDGYTLIAQEFPATQAAAETLSQAESGQLKITENVTDKKEFTAQKQHKWVLLLHGYTGWKEEMYPFAYWYHQEGYHVLVPDLRCQGESEGDYIGMGWTDHLDCMLWIDYILSEDPEAQIVIHGQSMGAATALMMTGNDKLSQNVEAVISDCSYTDAYAMFGEKIKEWFGLPAFPLVDSACIALKFRGGYNLRDASALDAVKNSDVPTFFIHGDEDVMISVEMTKELYQAAACPKELLIVEGAGHAQSQDKDPDTYYGKIKEFLDKTLANTE